MDCLANSKTGMALADVDQTKITIFLIKTREGRTLQKAFNASSNVLLLVHSCKVQFSLSIGLFLKSELSA